MLTEFIERFFSDWYRSFYYLALLCSTLAGVICIPFCSRGFKLITILLLISLLSEIVAKYALFTDKYSNNTVYHIFTPVEFLLYAVIFNSFLALPNWTKIVSAGVVLMVVAELINTAFFQGMNQTNTNTILLESVLIIILSLRLFLKIGETEIQQNITSSGVFWFNSAVLIYYSFNILVWGFHNMKVYQLKNPPTVIYELLLVLSGLLYLTFAFSIVLDVISNKQKDERIKRN